jgi:hypothetical protein
MFNAVRRSSLTRVEYFNSTKLSNSILAVAIGNTLYIQLLQRLLGYKSPMVNFQSVFIISLAIFILISYLYKKRIYDEVERIDQGKVNNYVVNSVYLYYLLSIILWIAVALV